MKNYQLEVQDKVLRVGTGMFVRLCMTNGFCR
jgi:hypothetical protein